MPIHLLVKFPHWRSKGVFYKEPPIVPTSLRNERKALLFSAFPLMLMAVTFQVVGHDTAGIALGSMAMGALIAIGITSIMSYQQIHRASFTVTDQGVSGFDLLAYDYRHIPWSQIVLIRLSSEEIVEQQNNSPVALSPEPASAATWVYLDPDVDESGVPTMIVGIIVENVMGDDAWFRVWDRGAVDAVLRGHAWYQAEFP